MKIVSSPSLPAGGVRWQPSPGEWTLTVVCKTTYALAAGTSPLTAEPEDLNDHDNHWDDDLQRAVYAPADLLPFKPHPEVVLVGTAYAPRAEPVASLTVRLLVGSLDKCVVVFGPRQVTAGGELQERRWTQMSLRYDHAAGGSSSWNPVGVDAEGTDGYGRRTLPNLEPLAHPEGALVPAVGYGPIAAAWRPRRERLRGAPEWRFHDDPVPAAFDGAFFQSALPDQWVTELRPDERLVLENLHPSHPRLVTQLADVRPRARVEAAGTPAWELALLPDTLWIDTSRALCTLTWRAQLPLDSRDAQGRIFVGAAEPGRPMRWPSDDGDVTAATSAPGKKPPLPIPLPSESSPRRAPPSPPPPPPVARLAPDSAALLGNRRLRHTTREFDGIVPSPGPAWLATPPTGEGSSTSAPPGPPPPSPDIAPPPLVSQMMRPAGLPFTSASAASDAALGPPPPPRPSLPSIPPVDPRPSRPSLPSIPSADPWPLPPPRPSLPPPPPTPEPRPPPLSFSTPDGRPVPASAPSGVLEASNAAAGPSAPRADPAPRSDPRAETGAHARVQPRRTLLEVIWAAPDLLPRLREDPRWAPQLASPPDASAGDAEKAKADRAALGALLARGAATGEVDTALLSTASDDGALATGIFLLEGTLELPFDEAETLRVLIAASVVLGQSDRRFQDVVDTAAAALKTPFGALPEVATSFISRIREAWAKANRTLPADYLDVQARRVLLEGRRYRLRELYGASWIRALFTSPTRTGPVPAYLPAASASHLPLFEAFPARLLGEPVPQVDQHEPSPVALRVSALGRLVIVAAEPAGRLAPGPR